MVDVRDINVISDCVWLQVVAPLWAAWLLLRDQMQAVELVRRAATHYVARLPMGMVSDRPQGQL